MTSLENQLDQMLNKARERVGLDNQTEYETLVILTAICLQLEAMRGPLKQIADIAEAWNCDRSGL